MKSKAEKILKDGEVRGHKLTPKQRGFFGAAASGQLSAIKKRLKKK